MGFAVPLNVFLTRETHPAKGAHEILRSVVNRSVTRQIPPNPETLPAYIAKMFLLPGVHRQMPQQLLFETEPFRAEGAFVRERIRVDFPMDAQRRHRFESFPARVANVRTFPGVNPPVIVPHALFQKRFPAQIAHVIPSVLVYGSDVPLKRVIMLKLFPAQMANERFLLLVRP